VSEERGDGEGTGSRALPLCAVVSERGDGEGAGAHPLSQGGGMTGEVEARWSGLLHSNVS